MPPIKRIGILTGGGDAPGLNAVIRAVVKSCCNKDIQVIGIEDSFDAAQAPRLDVKPWSAEDLAARVERLLDGAPVGPGAVSLGP